MTSYFVKFYANLFYLCHIRSPQPSKLMSFMKKSYMIYVLLILLLGACEQTTPKENREIISSDHHINKSKSSDSIIKTNKVYVPVYSDIYQRTRQERIALTSTLSIHNTSENDTLFISRIDYYNTEGNFVRKYIDSPIFLNTFETLEYVVDEDDNSGGSGANFVIEWYGTNQMRPLFQAVMIGGLGNKSFSFSTTGVEVP